MASSAVESDWFPEIKEPTSKVHQQINVLNLQAYPLEMFAKADSFLIFTAFTQKGKKRRHHAVKPEPAQPSASHNPLSKEDGVLAAKICKQHFSGSEPSWEAVVQTVSNLQDKIPDFYSDDQDWSACLRQYSLLYSSGSSVQIIKVSHTGQEASFGLKATRDIPPGTFIMETCSSMSLDCTSTPGPSVIHAASNQLGPMGPRLILGPFRLVNHDCKPNAQIMAIPNTYASVMATIQPISKGEEITIKYQKSGYYGQNCLCSTCTGKDTSDLSILKPNHDI